MARDRTKKQKKKADTQVVVKTTKEVEPKSKVKTTVFSQEQVNLLYKDLAKTFIVTVIVMLVLLSILVYMR